jgi:hypothetical protein
MDVPLQCGNTNQEIILRPQIDSMGTYVGGLGCTSKKNQLLWVEYAQISRYFSKVHNHVFIQPGSVEDFLTTKFCTDSGTGSGPVTGD